MGINLRLKVILLFVAVCLLTELFPQAESEESISLESIPTPQELWRGIQASLPPLKITIGKDEIIDSVTVPHK